MFRPRYRVPLVLALAVILLVMATYTSATASTFNLAFLNVVSGPSPFAPGCNGAPQTGTVYPNAEVEPWVDVNPTNPDNIVGAWQQDRWSNGGSNSLMAGVTFDRGQTWSRVVIPHITRCAGGNASNGGDYERASDPWLSFAPNGHLYHVSLSLNISNANNALLVSKSTSGGSSWSEPVVIVRDTDDNILNDKESITADPTNANYVYAIWDRLVFPQKQASAAAAEHAIGYRGPTWFSRTTNGGASWEAARMIYDPGEVNQTIGNQIVVLPNGRLVDVFNLIYNFKNSKGVRGYNVALIRSTDKGATWSGATVVDKLLTVGVVDPDTGAPLRTGDIIPEVAVDPNSGALYLVWQDSRFSGGAHDGIAFAKSTDGGLHWSAPVQINKVPSVAAFNPAIHVSSDGTIGVTYYDFRNNTPSPSSLPTDVWIIHSHDGGATWAETHVSGPFNMQTAPIARGYFVGDYQGLTTIGTTFYPFFVQTTGSTSNRTDVFAAKVGP